MRFNRWFRCIATVGLFISLMAAFAPLPALAHGGHDHDDPIVLGPGGAPPAGSGPVDVAGFTRGIDGDTLETWINGSQVGIGLIGVDVFEANTVCGAQAAQFLQGMLYGGFHAEEDPEYVFDSRLRRMYYVYTPAGESIAHALIAGGLARATGEGRDAAELLALEAQARDTGAGCAWDANADEILPKPPAEIATSESRELLSLPSGFQSLAVASGLNFPTDFAFLPDGRILIAEKSGLIRIAINGNVQSTPFIDLRDQVNDYWDRGMLSVAVDPNFSANGHVYFLFTYENNESNYSGTKTGRLIRVTASGNTANPATEVVILGTQVGSSCDNFPAGADCIPSDGPSHSTGGMRVAADGTLFLTLGEGADFNASTPQALRAQDLDSLGGKLVRITTTGQGLSTNPFWNGSPNDVRSKIWASGFRNAYRFSIRPTDGVPYVGDVGWVSWEEVNAAEAGANLGWPCYEGTGQQGAYSSETVCQQLYAAGTATPPVISWGHSEGGAAVTGGVFYSGVNYPAEYQGAYFYGDYARNVIEWAQISAGHTVQSGPFTFEDAAGGPVDFEIGPDSDLYYLSIATGEIRHIVYNGGSGSSNSAYVSDLAWATSSNGWGPVERDASNGEDSAGDGNTITINGTTYTKGIGAHAPSEIIIDLDGTCTQFAAVVGVDDEVDFHGSVIFEIYSGSNLLASSGVVTGDDGPLPMSVDLSGVTELRLVVDDAGDNVWWDHADWAEARIECGQDNTPPAVISTSPVDGATGVDVSSAVTAVFSESIDQSTLAGNVTLLDNGTPIAATLDYNDSSAQVAIIPDSALATGITYTAQITGGSTGVADLEGNRLPADVVWTFTTASGTGPVPTIATPLATDTFTVGSEISYSGSATDDQGQLLPANALRWIVLIYHCNHIDCHTHQVIDESGVSGDSFTVPDHGDQYYFEIELIATDNGQSNSTKVEVHPETINVTLNTVPAGLDVNLAGEQGSAPLTRPIVVGSVISVSAPSPQGSYNFDSWSDGGDRVHTVSVGASDISLTATFTQDARTTVQYLSDLATVSTTNGWGPVEHDQSNGEQGSGDGGPITIGGVVYPKGLGVHAPSTIVYSIDGCSLLRAGIGLDDEVGSNGSVIFEVRGDGGLLYQSGILRGSDGAEDIAVDITGVSSLELRVTDGGDNVYWDHADWGDARIECGGGPPPGDSTPPTVLSVTPPGGSAGVPVDVNITATFSEPIDGTTFPGNVTLAAQGGGQLSINSTYDATTNRLTMTPSNDLAVDTTYVVTISGGANGVADVAGNPLASDEVWTFTTVPPATGGEIFISDMTWISQSNGWGPVERDESNGEQGSGDGGPITIEGVTYAKGLGVHAASEVVVGLDGTCATFSAVVGLDDEVGSNGSVRFHVYGDGALLYSSPVLGGDDAGQPISIDVSGYSQIRLVTVDGGDNVYWDHADWADARLICGGGSPGDTTPPTVVSRTPAPGATDVDPATTVTALFSELLDPSSIAGSVTLEEQGGSLVPASVDYSPATMTITITPGSLLLDDTVYVVTLDGGSGGITDAAGNPLAADVVWSFTTSGSGAPGPLFEPPAKVAAGTNAHGVTVADVNADGDQDLVVAITGDDAVTILLGNGSGGFSASGSYPTGVHPKFATTGDFNGDGDLDFASANQDDTSGEDVSVYLGNGDGTFSLAGHFAACSNPHEVAPGDLNEDGDLDLAVVCWGGSVASVLLGNGDGTFQPATNHGVGSAPHSLVVADFDGDNNLDIATADRNSNTVSLLPGDGDGTFDNRLVRSVGTGPHSMRTADLNKDGDLDLVTANDGSDSVTVLFGNGDGTFSRDDFPVGDEPKGVALGDIDGDSWLDIITANIHGTYPCCSGQTSITVLFNDQSGGFTSREDSAIVSTPFSVATGDFNEDGRLDVASANWHTNDVGIFLGNR